MRSAPPIRLLHVTTVPMTFVFLRGQLDFMKSKGVEVHVMAAPGADMEVLAREEGVTAHAVPMARRITPFRDLITLLRMARVFRSLRPDIVHASTPKGGLLGTIAGRITGVPLVIYHVRGLPYTAARGVQGKLFRLTELVACGLAHQVLCVSHSVKTQLLADRLANPAKTVVLGNGSSNGVDAVKRFNPETVNTSKTNELKANLGIPEHSLVAGFVGRLVGDKGLHDLETAFALVLQSHPDAHLLIVGGWEPRDAVNRVTRERLESNPHVHFAGEQRDTASYYSVMDLVVLPTLREGFPNVPLEAAAMGIPVVATSVIGCIDAVADGETGTLVEPQNPVQLAGAISQYLGNSDLRRSHGQAGRKRVVELFQPKTVWSALYENYIKELARVRG